MSGTNLKGFGRAQIYVTMFIRGKMGGEPGKERRRLNVEYEFERLWTSADLCYNIDMGGEGVKLDSLNNFCS